MSSLLGDATITNALFHDNTASVGGALYNNSSSPVLTNATITRNTGSLYGGAMFNISNTGVSQVNPTFVNSIVWVNFGAELIYNCDTCNPVYSYSIVYFSHGSGPSWNTNWGVDGGFNLDADPVFVDALGGNMRLQSSSPAIDVGNDSAPNLPATDLGGNPRIIGAAVDMGAYEFGAGTGIFDPGENPAPAKIALHAVYPNPFNPTVTVTFELDRRREVRVVIFDVKGRRIREVFVGTKDAGLQRVTWDATDNVGKRVSSGVYFLEVQSDDWRDSRKIIMLK